MKFLSLTVGQIKYASKNLNFSLVTVKVLIQMFKICKIYDSNTLLKKTRFQEKNCRTLYNKVACRPAVQQVQHITT